jgi:cytidylate kinase
MYRAITWAALRRGVALDDEQALTALAESADIDVLPPSRADGRTSDVLIDGQDVTWEVRLPEVEANVSVVSAYPGVRQALTIQQRRIGMRGKIVMVGRDIGTVVLPDAELKIYLDASVDERAKRRYEEVHQRGETTSLKTILEGMRERDRIDSSRQASPLRPAQDAITLKSDGLDAGQVLEQVLALVQQE